MKTAISSHIFPFDESEKNTKKPQKIDFKKEYG